MANREVVAYLFEKRTGVQYQNWFSVGCNKKTKIRENLVKIGIAYLCYKQILDDYIFTENPTFVDFFKIAGRFNAMRLLCAAGEWSLTILYA